MEIQLTIMWKLGWAPTQRISKRNSTNNTSWGPLPFCNKYRRALLCI